MDIFLRIDGENAGPLTIYDVREMLRSGKATPETKCWVKGMPEWVPLAEFPPLENDTTLRVAGAGADDIAVSDEEREAAIPECHASGPTETLGPLLGPLVRC